MIHQAIAHTASALNQALGSAFALSEELVVVSSLYEPDGSVAANVHNKLAVFLVNIERDTMPGQLPRHDLPSGRLPRLPAPVTLNLMVMFAAHFHAANYAEALKFVAGTIAFFQSRPVLTHENTPGLDARIDRLALDIENLGLGDLSNLWGTFGGRYLPSVLYRMRLVTLDGGQLDAQVPVVREPVATVRP
jgi:hypothetical protein